MSDPVALKARFERLHDFWNGAFDVSLNEDSRIRPRIYGLFVGSVADRSIVARRQGAVVRGNRRIDDAPVEPGVRIHMRNALCFGATPAQVLRVAQIVSCVGMQSFLLDAPHLRSATT